MNVRIVTERGKYIFPAPRNVVAGHLWLKQPGKQQISTFQ